MNWPLLVAALALLGVLISWGIHATAYQCGRLSGLAEAHRDQRRELKDEYDRGRIAGIVEATQYMEANPAGAERHEH